MTTFGLAIGVGVALFVHIAEEAVVALLEEVGLADSHIVEVGAVLGGEEVGHLLVEVGIDGAAAWFVLAATTIACAGTGEESDVAVLTGIVLGDMLGVERTHRETGNGAMALVVDGAEVLLDIATHVGERQLEGCLLHTWLDTTHHHFGLTEASGLLAGS